MSTITHPRSSIITRHRVEREVVWMPVTIGVFALVVAAITAAVSVFGTVTTSAWEVASQLPRFYAAGIGGYLMGVHLPLYIAHGFSRREFMGQSPGYMLIVVTSLSLLMTLGYALESVLYGWLGWEQALSNTHLFTEPTQYPLVLIEFLLLHAAWFTGGMVVIGAFYRDGRLGVASILVGLAAVLAVESTLGSSASAPFTVTVPGMSELPVAQAVTVGVAVSAVLLAMSWLLARDMPLRSKKS